MTIRGRQRWGRLPHQLVKVLIIALLATAYLLICLVEYLADLREGR